MQFLSTILFLQALVFPILAYPTNDTQFSNTTCIPSGKSSKKLLRFDDLHTNSSAGFTQIGTPDTPLVYKGFHFHQYSQWFLLSCSCFPHSNPYFKACALGSSKALWSPNNTGNSSHAVARFRGGPELVFDLDSFWITPVAFQEREALLTVTGKYAPGSSWSNKREPSHEQVVITDKIVHVKGLREEGFVELSEVEIHVWDGSVGVVFVVDEFAVRVNKTSCDS